MALTWFEFRSLPFAVLLTFACALSCALPAFGQSTTLLRGYIVHATDERPVVGRVRVTAVRLDGPPSKPISVVSDEFGYFQFPPLSPGRYQLAIVLPPFRPHVEVVTVVRNPISTVMLRLQLRDGERIEVPSERSPGTRLLMSDGSIGAAFSWEALEDLPQVNGRTLQSILALVPGVVFTDSVGTLAQFTAGGQRRFANRLTIDGISADLALDVRGQGLGEAASGGLHATATSGSIQTLVPQDAIEEIAVRTSVTNAEYARTPGAQTSIVTRSGGDRLSVSGFGLGRPTAWSASDWFANAGHAPDRDNSLANVGASVGGPLSGRMRLFTTWETQELSRATQATLHVPSLEARNAAPAPLRQLLDAFPVPNGQEVGAGLAEYADRAPVGSKLWALSTRLDVAGVRHRYFVRGNVGRSNGDALALGPVQVPFLSYGRIESTVTTTTTGGWTWLHPKAVGELRTSFSAHAGRLDYEAARHGGARPLDLASLMPDRSGDTAAIFVVFPGPHGIVASGPARQNDHRQFQALNTIATIFGRHQLKAGVEYSLVATSLKSAQHVDNYRFGGVNRLLQQAPVQATLFRVEPAEIVRHSGAAFIQDTWRVSDALTVDYGFRYGVSAPPLSSNTLQPLLLDFSALPERKARPAGARPWRTSWKDVAPRIGLAYKRELLSDRATVLHAGWGLTFDTLTSPGASAYGGGSPYMTGRQELVQFPMQVVADSANPPLDLELSEYYAFPTTFPSPRTSQWQAGIAQELTAHQRFSLAYVGARARNLVYGFWYPVSSRTAINAFAPLGESEHRGILTEYVRRLAGSWQARVSYAWSKTIDTDSGESLVPNAPPSMIPVASNRGPADFDRPHNVVLSVSYHLRVEADRSRMLSRLCDGWVVAASMSLRSGTPFSVIEVRRVDGQSYQLRPDIVKGVPLWLQEATSPAGRRLNPAAFDSPESERQGTSGRNSLRSSPLRQVDVSLSRTVRWKGTTTMAKVEVFNLTNTPNFGRPLSDLQATPFGIPQQSYADALGSGTLGGGGLAPLQQQGGPHSIQLGFTFRF